MARSIFSDNNSKYFYISVYSNIFKIPTKFPTNFTKGGCCTYSAVLEKLTIIQGVQKKVEKIQMAYRVSKRGRTYQPGVALSNDLRNLIISNIISLGGDRLTGHFPGTYSEIANTLKISPRAVSKIWNDFCHTHAFECKKRGGDFSSKLTAGDLELIETLKAEKGSIPLREIYGLLEDLGDVGGDISL